MLLFLLSTLVSQADPPVRPTVTLPYDGWAYYAKAGGLVVGPGRTTGDFMYGCDTRWQGDEEPQCRVGRSAIHLPGHAFQLIGFAFMTFQRLRGGSVVKRVPLVNLALLDHGGYVNVLFRY